MSTITKYDVERLADAWDNLPEGAAGTPMITMLVTPKAVLTLMEMTGMTTVEGEIIAARPPLTVADVMPDRLSVAFMLNSVADEPAEAPVGVHEGYRAPSYGPFDLREGR